MIEQLYYSHNGKGPGVARIISRTVEYVEFECKSDEKAKRWSYVKMTIKAFERSGWKRRIPASEQGDCG